MIARATARQALDALWQVMVELAEAANDHVVETQASANASAAKKIAALTGDLADIAKAASVIARHVRRA